MGAANELGPGQAAGSDAGGPRGRADAERDRTEVGREQAAMRRCQDEEGHGPVDVELEELESMEELRPLEDLQRRVWGVDDLEVVPASAMRAAVHAGGLVVGARVAGETIGFAFGFVATPHGRGMDGVGMHSHMAAVLPELRRSGVGRRLKRYQASWCAERGLRWISWTFDPLRAENARFNLAVLGARCYDYLVDFYGPMPGTLGAGLESDRLLAVWQVAGREPAAVSGTAVASGPPAASGPALASGMAAASGMGAAGDEAGSRGARGSGAAAVRAGTWLLPPGDEPHLPGDAELYRSLAGADPLLVAVPATSLDVFSRPRLAMAWRAAHRRTLAVALECGWSITGFRDGAYVLQRDAEAGPE